MKKQKILMLEDNKLDAKLIEEELLEHKFDFISKLVDTEKDFITAIHNFQPDIILSDYRLPQFTGFEALEIAKKLVPTIPFIIVTGTLSEEEAVESIKRGSWDYIIKENLVRLVPAIENSLKLKEEKDKKKRAEIDLQKAFHEIKELRDKLQAENIILRKKIKPAVLDKDFIGESPIIQDVISKAIQVANQDTTVLLYGETGTGKEMIARGIHNASNRKDNTLVTINCAAIPETLVESELFGSEKGAYTDSKSKKIGIFEIADKSTLLLDEVGELPLNTQSKLLRVLENREIIRVGGNKPIKVDVRIIATTNQKLESLIKKKQFRQDLYYRLNVYPIELPPLRNRVEDIPLLTEKFVEYFNNQMGKTVETISKRDIEKLKKYSWPGNARELKNIIERSMISSVGKNLIIDIPDSIDNDTAKITNLEDLERNHILSTLERTYWKISGKGGAAEILGLHPNTLNARIKKLGIKRPK